MIKVTLTNDILKKISSIDENRFSLSTIELPPMTKNRLHKNSNIVSQRIRSYSLSEFTKRNEKKILSKLGNSMLG